MPFDAEPELVRTGTTANYRTVHLQRLANPLLPWNPPPGQIKDVTGADINQPNLPVNPYLTVDTSSVDLTAFNGVSDAEGNYPDNPSGDTGKVKQRKLGQFRPWIRTDSPTPPPNLPGQTGFYLNMNQKGAQVWQFKSRERGAYNQLSTTHLIRDYTTPTNTSDRLLPLPQRVIFAGEPVTGSIADFNPDPNPAYPTGIWAISDGRNTTMMASAIPQKVLSNENIEPSTDDKRTNHVDAVLEHSLGFGNESDGRLFMQQPSNLSADYAPVTAAVGVLREYSFHDSTYTPPGDPITKGEHTTSSTYPWLAWDNRPYVSAEEILKVPAASQSEMLRMYSAVDPNVPAANRNPYDGTGLIDPSQPPSAANLKDTQVPLSRLTVSLSPFGGLLNVFATGRYRQTFCAMQQVHHC